MKKLKKLNQKTLYSFPLGITRLEYKGGEGRLEPPLKKSKRMTNERIYRIF